MKKKIFIALTAFVITSTILAQSNSLIQYRVTKGDTVSKISREYDISVSEIYKYNPDAKGGISEGALLLLPGQKIQGSSDVSSVSQGKAIHVVQPKETLYSISKKYALSIEQLYSLNPTLKETGLLADSELIVGESASKPFYKQEHDRLRSVSTMSSSKVDTIQDINNIYYKNISVKAQETLYSLAVQYNTSVQRLLELNPEAQSGLQLGQILKVPDYGQRTRNEVVQPAPKAEDNLVRLTIEPQQTLYSISKKHGISIKEIIRLNPELNQGLKVGMEILVPALDGASVEENTGVGSDYVYTENTSGYVDLKQSLYRGQAKELALLVPFNIESLGENVDAKLATDNFLNMALDFYSGAKMAVEYAESLNLPLTVQVYDSNESKSKSGVMRLFNQMDFRNTDVIIGPFFQSHVDEAARALPNDKVVLVSPLSNEKATASDRLVQTMPYSDVLKTQLLEYFKRTDAKITVIVDDKKQSTKQFMSRNYADLKTISTNQINDIDKTLVKGKTNVFILDSNSMVSAMLFIDKLKTRTKEYDIQIASFDKSTIFDYSEIRIETLVDLKYTFPSVTRDADETKEDSTFGQDYKNKYNVYPNRYATRGFDVTLDVIYRMFQQEEFMQTFGKKSQEIENRFNYSRNSDGTFRNNGVFLLQYDTDLTVKVLNN